MIYNRLQKPLLFAAAFMAIMACQTSLASSNLSLRTQFGDSAINASVVSFAFGDADRAIGLGIGGLMAQDRAYTSKSQGGYLSIVVKETLTEKLFFLTEVDLGAKATTLAGEAKVYRSALTVLHLGIAVREDMLETGFGVSFASDHLSAKDAEKLHKELPQVSSFISVAINL